MLRILTVIISSIFIFGCSEINFKSKEKIKVKTTKTEMKKENKKPIIKFSNPFTDDVDIEDILGR